MRLQALIFFFLFSSLLFSFYLLFSFFFWAKKSQRMDGARNLGGAAASPLNTPWFYISKVLLRKKTDEQASCRGATDKVVFF